MDQTPFEVKFFKQTSGKEPVREWLKELDPLVERSRYRGGKNKFISVANSQPKV